MSYFAEPIDITADAAKLKKGIWVMALICLLIGVGMYVYKAIWTPDRLDRKEWLFWPIFYFIFAIAPNYLADKWQFRAIGVKSKNCKVYRSHRLTGSKLELIDATDEDRPFVMRHETVDVQAQGAEVRVFYDDVVAMGGKKHKHEVFVLSRDKFASDEARQEFITALTELGANMVFFDDESDPAIEEVERVFSRPEDVKGEWKASTMLGLFIFGSVSLTALVMWNMSSDAVWGVTGTLWRAALVFLPFMWFAYRYRQCWMNLRWKKITEGYVLDGDTVSKRHWGDNGEGPVLLFEHPMPLSEVKIAEVDPQWVKLRTSKKYFAKKLSIFGMHFASEAGWKSFLLDLQARGIEIECKEEFPPARARVIHEQVADKKSPV